MVAVAVFMHAASIHPPNPAPKLHTRPLFTAHAKPIHGSSHRPPPRPRHHLQILPRRGVGPRPQRYCQCSRRRRAAQSGRARRGCGDDGGWRTCRQRSSGGGLPAAAAAAGEWRRARAVMVCRLSSASLSNSAALVCARAGIGELCGLYGLLIY